MKKKNVGEKYQVAWRFFMMMIVGIHALSDMLPVSGGIDVSEVTFFGILMCTILGVASAVFSGPDESASADPAVGRDAERGRT